MMFCMIRSLYLKTRWNLLIRECALLSLLLLHRLCLLRCGLLSRRLLRLCLAAAALSRGPRL